jgi:hypothetical protein
MKQKFKIAGVMAFFLVGLQLVAFGGDKTFFIAGSGITRAGANLSTSQINFYLNDWATGLTLTEVGGAALASPITITSGSVVAPTSAGRNVQYSNASIGQSLNAMVWSGSVGLGNFYARTSLPMNSANYSNSTLTWDLTGLAVDYKAAAPYTPKIDTFVDSTTSYTDGSTPPATNLTAHSVAGSGSDGLREVTAYYWKWWKPADPANPGNDEPAGNGTAGGDTLVLNSTQVTAGLTYAFKVYYGNQWSATPTPSNIQTHKAGGTATGSTGGGGIGGPVTYPLTSAGLGLNVVSIDFDTTKGPITDGPGTKTVASQGDKFTIQMLINEINRQAGASIVKTIGYYDNGLKKQVGLSSLAMPLDASAAVGDSAANILSHRVQEPLQIGVSADLTTFTLSGTK